MKPKFPLLAGRWLDLPPKITRVLLTAGTAGIIMVVAGSLVGKQSGTIGIDKIMWSSDYPHAASTWPKSSEFIERDCAGAPPEEKELVVRGTVSKLYGFEL